MLIASGLLASGASAAEQDGAPVENLEPSSQTSASSNINAQTLDELIPQAAQENPEDWANGGATKTPEIDPQAAQTIKVELDSSFEDSEVFDISAALDNENLPAPRQLPLDPARPSFADIDAPTLEDIPELAQVEISRQLALAFPVQTDAFPEETDFIARFRALSAIEQLGTGQDTVPQLAARARSDQNLLNAILRNYGYYDGEVIRQLSGGRRGFADEAGTNRDEAVDRDPKVRFDVLPGPRYVLGAIDLGPLDDLADLEKAPLLDALGFTVGDPVYADAIVAGEGRLRLALGESGYPFSILSPPDLLIDHSRRRGDLTLPVETGGQFVFGEVVSDDPAFLSGRHLGNIGRFSPGELYRTSLQSDLRRAIIATGLVSSVAITPRAVSQPTPDSPGEVALDVAIERAPLRTISGALGFGTQDGFKLEAGWEHRNLFPPEGALRLRGIVGTREQLASVTFRRSNFRGRDQILTLDAFASAIETEAVDARTVAFQSAFERVSNLLFQKPLSWQVGAELLYSDERNRVTNGIARPRQEYLIGGVFGRATLDGSDDLLDPRKGYRLTFFAEPEVSRTLGVTSPYLRARVDGSFYQLVGGAVIAGRIAAATVVGADLLDIAPSRRLYSGGGGSVRGFGFQAIGPRNSFDEPEGGRSLIEAAVEARIPTRFLDGALEIVPFFDLGSISNEARPDLDVVKAGAGVGVRYKTSFGPIRVDLGVPLNPSTSDAPVVVYVSLGQAF